jgi:hypothetical protein
MTKDTPLRDPTSLSADDGRANMNKDLLASFIATNEVYCPACRYRMRALTEPKCPECGYSLTLALASARPPRAFCFVLVASSLTASVGLIRWTAYLSVGLDRVFKNVMEVGFPWYYLVLDLVILATPFAWTVMLLRQRWLASRSPRTLWIAGSVFLAVFILEVVTRLF